MLGSSLKEHDEGESLGEAAIRSVETHGPRAAWDARRCRPLPGLAGTSVAERFRSWTGRSGRRYVFSVFPCEASRAGTDQGPPTGSAVVIGVERAADGTRRACFVAETGPAPDRFFGSDVLEGFRRRPGAELHLHLMAADDGERQRIAADLSTG